MKKVLITGTDRGIGLQLAKQFLENGYKVIATYQGKPSEELKTLDHDKKITIFELNVTSEQSVNQLVRQLNKKSIDILIHNTEIIGPENQSIDDMDFSAWQHTFNTNAIAPFALTGAMLEMLQRTNQPKVISLYHQSNQQVSNMYAHQSAMAAQNKIMLMLANELKKSEVIVCPIQLYRERTNTSVDDEKQNNQYANNILKLIENLKIEDSGKIQFLVDYVDNQKEMIIS